MEITRRDFLKLAGAAAGAAVAVKWGLEASEERYESDSTAGKIRRLILGPIPEFATDEEYLDELLSQTATAYASFFGGGGLVNPESLIEGTYFLSKAELVEKYQRESPDFPMPAEIGGFVHRDETGNKIYIAKDSSKILPTDPRNDLGLREDPLIISQNVRADQIRRRIEILGYLVHEFGHAQVERERFYPWYKFKGYGSLENEFLREKVDPDYMFQVGNPMEEVYILGFDGFTIFVGNEDKTGSINHLEEAVADWEENEFAAQKGLSDLFPPISHYLESQALRIIIDRLGINPQEIMQAHHNSDGESLINLFSKGVGDSRERVVRFMQIVSLIRYAGEARLSEFPLRVVSEELDKLLGTDAIPYHLEPGFVKWVTTPETRGVFV